MVGQIHSCSEVKPEGLVGAKEELDRPGTRLGLGGLPVIFSRGWDLQHWLAC